MTFPGDIKDYLIPFHADAGMAYECIGCEAHYPLDRFLYTCPSCAGLLRIADLTFEALKDIPGPGGKGSSITAGCSTATGSRGSSSFMSSSSPSSPLIP